MNVVAKRWVIVQILLEGKSRKAEEVLGWNRHTVERGINEFRTGIRCISDVSARGKKKTIRSC